MRSCPSWPAGPDSCPWWTSTWKYCCPRRCYAVPWNAWCCGRPSASPRVFDSRVSRPCDRSSRPCDRSQHGGAANGHDDVYASRPPASGPGGSFVSPSGHLPLENSTVDSRSCPGRAPGPFGDEGDGEPACPGSRRHRVRLAGPRRLSFWRKWQRARLKPEGSSFDSGEGHAWTVGVAVISPGSHPGDRRFESGTVYVCRATVLVAQR